MGVVKLTESDLHRLIRNTVENILRESTDEKSGSAMENKENEIEAIVTYIRNMWAVRGSADQEGPIMFADDEGNRGTGYMKSYLFSIPPALTAQLGIAENFVMQAVVNDIIFDEQYQHFIGYNETRVGGTSYGNPEDYLVPLRKDTEIVFKNSRIDLEIPAINGKLQVPGIYSTLYHELNHSFTNLMSAKHGKIDDNGVGVGMYDAQRRDKQGKYPAFDVHQNMIRSSMQTDPFGALHQQMLYGPYKEAFHKINYLIYSLWEITERNARVEQMYGDLQALKATRANFQEIYPQTEVYHRLQEYEGMLQAAEAVPVDTNVWAYVAQIIHEKSRGRAKKRFISRTRQLMDILYKKSMKVARYYFDKHEGPEKTPEA